MSKWKMVPVEPTTNMLFEMSVNDWMIGKYEAALAAAPAWEPSEEDVWRAFQAEAGAFAECVADGTLMEHGQHYARRISLRAAIKAALGGEDENG